MKLIITFIFLFIISGCTNITTHTAVSNPLPAGVNKEVYIQPGTMRVLGPIKEQFRQNKWKVNEIDKDSSRFFVHLNTKKIQLLCWNENSELEVELNLMDKQTGRTVFSIYAQTCDEYKNLTEELSKALKGLN